MGLQKFRADTQGAKCKNGSIPFFTEWLGGPTLSLIKNCPINAPDISTRTVYITGEANTYFSIPAAITFKRKTIKGFVTCDENGYLFHPNNF